MPNLVTKRSARSIALLCIIVNDQKSIYTFPHGYTEVDLHVTAWQHCRDNAEVLCLSFTCSGAAVTPDGPAPKSMLANYTVLLTTEVTPTWRPQLSLPNHPSPPTPETPRLGWSSSSGSESASAAVLAGGVAKVPVAASSPAARFEEADVRDALVDRDVGESIVCRRRYRILPDFKPGDRPYVVSESGDDSCFVSSRNGRCFRCIPSRIGRFGPLRGMNVSTLVYF